MQITFRSGFFLGSLTLLFVIAKLLGLVTWSWWLVLLPACLPFVLTGALLVILCVLALLIGVITGVCVLVGWAYEQLVIRRGYNRRMACLKRP